MTDRDDLDVLELEGGELDEDCELFLETWLSRTPHIPDRNIVAGEGRLEADPTGHLERCPRCQQLVSAFAGDQQRLQEHFAAISIPRPPALAPRPALRAASGHPRRVSLNVLPFLLLLLLGFLLMTAMLAWLITRPGGS